MTESSSLISPSRSPSLFPPLPYSSPLLSPLSSLPPPASLQKLAGALVNNCGPSLHREISGKAFTQTLMRLINDRTTHESVKKEALSKIEEWVKEFGKRDEFGM